MPSLKEIVKQLQHKNILAWIINNNIKTETGQLFDFDDHRYLIDPYLDTSKNLCCLKAGQIGFSNMAILKTTWLAHYKKMEIGYILPTVDMVNKFVSSKVNRIAQQNEVVGSWMKDKDSITQKQIGESFIHYLGAMTDRSAIMLTLDVLVADEYDKAPQEILETYDSRLQHSLIGYKWVFSNPTIPDFGVDKYWRISDQKKWHISHKCGNTYVLDEACIDYQQKKFICPKCTEEITDNDRRNGKWLPTAKGLWSGYWIPLWLNTMHSAEKIAEYKKSKTAEYFANFVAGLPYTGSGNKVNASTIIKCISPKINTQEDRVIIGVDTGLPIHYVLGNKQGLFFYGKCSDPLTGKDPYLELEALLKRFPNSIMISDQGGDLIGIRNLQAKYPGRVFLAWYRADQKSVDLFKWGDNEEYGKVVIDRNRMIQWYIDEMQAGRVTINGTESDWQEYITHWMNIYRTWEKDESGQIDKTKGFKWERNGADHWVHATMYWRTGLEKYAETFANVIGGGLLDDIPMERFQL
jgi:hypothetical protein